MLFLCKAEYCLDAAVLGLDSHLEGRGASIGMHCMLRMPVAPPRIEGDAIQIVQLELNQEYEDANQSRAVHAANTVNHKYESKSPVVGAADDNAGVAQGRLEDMPVDQRYAAPTA